MENFLLAEPAVNVSPSRHWLVQIQQWKQQSNEQNLSKSIYLNAPDQRQWRRSGVLLLTWTDFTYCSGVSIAHFEQVNAS